MDAQKLQSELGVSLARRQHLHQFLLLLDSLRFHTRTADVENRRGQVWIQRQLHMKRREFHKPQTLQGLNCTRPTISVFVHGLSNEDDCCSKTFSTPSTDRFPEFLLEVDLGVGDLVE